MNGFDSAFGRKFPHNQRQLTAGCRLDGGPINPLHVFRWPGTTAVNFHDKFRLLQVTKKREMGGVINRLPSLTLAYWLYAALP